jgi:hypothetical protein
MMFKVQEWQMRGIEREWYRIIELLIEARTI